MLNRVDVDDGRETDNDVYIFDADQFLMYDGPGNDRYDLVSDSAQGVESIGHNDTTGGSGKDRVTFTVIIINPLLPFVL